MKIKVNATLEGAEILEKFLAQLKENNITAGPEDCKIFVLNKQNAEVEISVDKLKITYNKE